MNSKLDIYRAIKSQKRCNTMKSSCANTYILNPVHKIKFFDILRNAHTFITHSQSLTINYKLSKFISRKAASQSCKSMLFSHALSCFFLRFSIDLILVE